ncbi:MAG TPA: response regulator transcription factor [Bacillota bacterium]
MSDLSENLTGGKPILVVEDDHGVTMGLSYALKQEGWRVAEAPSLAEARKLYAAEEPALAIVDIGLPDGSGFDLVREWRKTSPVPILFLTARDLEADKVLGLEIGGDDYVTKPFGVRELVARCRALLRRVKAPGAGEAPTFRTFDLLVDMDKRKVQKGQEVVHLTHTEFEILRHLAKRPGKVFSREELIQSIWDVNFFGGAKTIDVHIRNLRQKLGDGPDGKGYVETVRGAGYKWRES